MEEFIKPVDKEYMKIAMLKHEETFREQVFELHRLYRIQKTLMKSTARTNWATEIIRNDNRMYRTGDLDLERHPVEITEGNDQGTEIVDECEIELTLGPTSYTKRKKAETQLTSDSSPSFSSSSTGSSQVKRRVGTRENVMIHRWGHIGVPESNPSFLSGRKSSGSGMEEQMRNPSWLYQPLSLNMT